MHFLLIVIASILCFASEISGARILGLIHVPAFSHQQLGQKLLIELAAKGHEVTMISPMLPKNPIKNLKTMELKIEREDDEAPNMFEQTQMNLASKILWLDMMGLYFTDYVLNHTTLQTLLKSEEKFDIVIIEQFVNEAFKGLCYHFKASCVLLSTVGTSRWTNTQMGNLGPPSYVPDLAKIFLKKKLEEILKVFSKLKQKILWKWEDETLPGQPSNVKLGKWLPQQDILAHPNVKLFITHGGLLSTIETIYHGVPIVGIPVYGDQEMNVANAEIAGFGIGVPFNQFTEKTFGDALKEVLNNPTYTENAKRRSKIMHDQPMKPLDRAVFWVEYVHRHQGAPHLRSAALNLAWYQYLLLDVVALVVLVIITVLFVCCKLFKLLFVKRNSLSITQSKKSN